MSTKPDLKAVSRRERTRKTWSAIVAVSYTLRLASIGYAIWWLGSIIMFFNDVRLVAHIQTHSFVQFLISVAAAVLMTVAIAFARKRRDHFIDPAFGIHSYASVTRSLRKLGIAKPAIFLAKNPDAVAAYMSVKLAAVNKIDTMYHLVGATKAQRTASATKIAYDGHLIAMLVLPGQDEMRREQRLLDYIENRSIVDLDVLTEMLKDTDAHPLSLMEGAL